MVCVAEHRKRLLKLPILQRLVSVTQPRVTCCHERDDRARRGCVGRVTYGRLLPPLLSFLLYDPNSSARRVSVGPSRRHKHFCGARRTQAQQPRNNLRLLTVQVGYGGAVLWIDVAIFGGLQWTQQLVEGRPGGFLSGEVNKCTGV